MSHPLEIYGPCLPRVPVDVIQRVVAEYFNLPPSAFVSQRRNIRMAHPRMVAMHFARRFTPLSYPKIGHFFGGRHHSTVIHGLERVQELAAQQVRYRVALDFLDAQMFDIGKAYARHRAAMRAIEPTNPSTAKLMRAIAECAP